MEIAEKILVVYGTVSLTVGFLLGLPLSQARNQAPEAPHHLVTAHLSAIIQGAVHLGLSVAVAFSSLTAWLETTAAGCSLPAPLSSSPAPSPTGVRTSATTSRSGPLAGSFSQPAAPATYLEWASCSSAS